MTVKVKVGYYQQETVTTISERETNIQELFDTLSTPAYRLFVGLQRYFTDLRINNRERWSLYQRAVHTRDSIRATNVLDITIEMLIEYKGVSKYGEEKRTKYQARKQLKELVKAGVIAKVNNEISDADTYMINPLYIYIGSKLGDCTAQWCNLTECSYDFKLMQRVYMVKHYNGPDAGRVFPAIDPNMQAEFDKQSDKVFPAAKWGTRLYSKPIGPQQPLDEYDEWLALRQHERMQHPKYLKFAQRQQTEFMQIMLNKNKKVVKTHK